MHFKIGKQVYKLQTYQVTEKNKFKTHLVIYAIHEVTGVMVIGNLHMDYSRQGYYRNQSNNVSNNFTELFAQELLQKLERKEKFNLRDLKEEYYRKAEAEAVTLGCSGVDIYLHIDVNAKKVKEELKRLKQLTCEE